MIEQLRDAIMRTYYEHCHHPYHVGSDITCDIDCPAPPPIAAGIRLTTDNDTTSVTCNMWPGIAVPTYPSCRPEPTSPARNPPRISPTYASSQ